MGEETCGGVNSARGRDRRPDGGAVGEADGDALAAVAAQHFQAPHAQGGGGWAR